MHKIVDNAAWSFETAQFFTGFYAEPEDLDPADSFQFEEDIEAVRSGSVEWFCAAVRVYFKNSSDNPHEWLEVGADYLGGCAYNSVREFYTAHRAHKSGDYFTDMIREALGAARTTLAGMTAVKLRAA